MKSQILHTVWCHISCEAAGEFWHWSLSGVKGLRVKRLNADTCSPTPPSPTARCVYMTLIVFFSQRNIMGSVNSNAVLKLMGRGGTRGAPRGTGRGGRGSYGEKLFLGNWENCLVTICDEIPGRLQIATRKSPMLFIWGPSTYSKAWQVWWGLVITQPFYNYEVLVYPFRGYGRCWYYRRLVYMGLT